MNTRAFPLLAAAVVLAACASTTRIAGGDGSTIEAAVLILGAPTLEDQNQAMLTWIAKNIPDGALNQSESRYILSRRVLYAARVDAPSVGQRVIYFDITDMPRR